MTRAFMGREDVFSGPWGGRIGSGQNGLVSVT